MGSPSRDSADRLPVPDQGLVEALACQRGVFKIRVVCEVTQ
jgi:hypothetical protein